MAITSTPRTENINGSDLTGSDGAANRTYSFAYGNALDGGLSVILSGSVLQEGTDFSRSGQVITFTVNVFDSQKITLNYFTESSLTSLPSTQYATTLELNDFMGMTKQFPDPLVVGEARNRENVGTGDNSETIFWLDNAFVIADTYTLEYGASEASLTTLTETTHYTIDKDLGKITLTASGVTALGTNIMYASYSYNCLGIKDSVLADSIQRASTKLNNLTNNLFVDTSQTPPAWGSAVDETHDGRGIRDLNYFLKNIPVADVSSTLNGAVSSGATSITLDDASQFPTSGTVACDGHKITYTGKSTNDLTGVSGVGAAIADGTTVTSWVVETSTSATGSTPSYDVLKPDTDYAIDLSTGRVRIFTDNISVDTTSVVPSESPIRHVPDRFRVSYVYGTAGLPTDIVQLNLMLAASDIMRETVRKAHAAGLNDFNPDLINVDQAEIDKLISYYSNRRYGRP